MEKKTNETLMRNVNLLSRLTDQEVGMKPLTEAPLPSVDQVKQVVCLVKSIIFPDYFTKRQPNENPPMARWLREARMPALPGDSK